MPKMGLMLLLVVSSILACPPELLVDAGNPFAAPFEVQRRATLTLLQQSDASVRDINVRITRPQADYDLYQWKAVLLVTRGRGKEEMPDTHYLFFEDDGLSGRFDVYADFRDMGIAKLLLLGALKANPTVDRIHPVLEDTNLAAFCTALSSGETDVQVLRRMTANYEASQANRISVNSVIYDEVSRLSGKARAKRYRERILDIYWKHTPSGRMNTSLGFRSLRTMTLRINPKLIQVNADLGWGEPRPGANPPRILVVEETGGPGERTTRELFPDGSYRVLKE